MDLDALCDRIDAVDQELRAFVAEPDRRERLRQAVAKLAERWPDEWNRPPLFGIPVAVKDILHVAGLPTRAGSALPPDVLTGDQADVVTCLEDNGAVVLGKTVTAEFAFLTPGPTRNPHHHEHTPGGSSSGSAAAVAAALAPAALGTQTVGSVIRPAAYCGVPGFKPTYGRISTAGVIANAPTFDTVGLFASDLPTLGRLAAATCTNWTPAAAAAEPGPVLGVPTGPYLDQTEPDARTAFDAQVAALRADGHEVRDVPALGDITRVNERNLTINLYELARGHARWFAEYADRYQERTAAAIRDGQRIDAADYERALRERADFASQLEERMAGIDAWIAPAATGPAPFSLDSTGSPLMNLPWTQARLPVVGVPAGTAPNGLPLGIQLVARPHQDERLLSWAAVLGVTRTRAGSPGSAPASG